MKTELLAVLEAACLFIFLFGLLALLMMSVEYRWWWVLITALSSLLALGTTLGSVRRSETASPPPAESTGLTLVSPVPLARPNALPMSADAALREVQIVPRCTIHPALSRVVLLVRWN